MRSGFRVRVTRKRGFSRVSDVRVGDEFRHVVAESVGVVRGVDGFRVCVREKIALAFGVSLRKPFVRVWR